MKALFGITLCAALLAVPVRSAVGDPSARRHASLRGRLSGDARLVRAGGEWEGGGAIRYLPQLTLGQAFGTGGIVDLETSVDAYGAAESGEDPDADAELYRLKLRLATQRTETRLGLQQLNFGPAYLLRPLRWFDVLDPRDPLALTDGVYALSAKYTAQSNASIWLWGLYGNSEPKGLETLPSVDDEPELGGRVQVPVPRGEMGATYHRRRVEGPAPFIGEYEEQRFALDGRWDVEIGLWFEATLTRSENTALPFEWSTLAMIGADYTLPLANGVHVLVESMAAAVSAEPFGWQEDSWISGLMIGYSPGYRDRISAIAFHDWDEREPAVYASWERSWDNVAFNVSAFHNPATASATGSARAFALAGDGAQLMLLFHH